MLDTETIRDLWIPASAGITNTRQATGNELSVDSIKYSLHPLELSSSRKMQTPRFLKGKLITLLVITGFLSSSCLQQEAYYNERALWVVKESRDKRRVEPLITLLRDHDPGVRSEAALSLGDIGDSRGVQSLVITLQDKHVIVRASAAIALGIIKDVRAVEPLIVVATLRNEASRVRGNAAWALGEIKDARAVGPLVAVLQEDCPLGTLKSIVDKVGKIKRERWDHLSLYWKGCPYATLESVVDEITLLAEDERNFQEVRIEAAKALGKIGDALAIEQLSISALLDISGGVRRSSAEALKRIGDPYAAGSMIATLGNSDPWVRKRAVWVLGVIGDERIIEQLKAALGDANIGVREAAKRALDNIRK